jgi:hypothetical protein
MDNALQFVARDPQKAMDKFNIGLRRAVKIAGSKMDALVAQDNAQRASKRTESGQAKRGPKPKN